LKGRGGEEADTARMSQKRGAREQKRKRTTNKGKEAERDKEREQERASDSTEAKEKGCVIAYTQGT